MFERFTSALLIATGAIADYYPGDSCCTFYDGEYFASYRSTLCISTSDDIDYFNMIAFGAMRSYECGNKVHYDLCENKGYGNCTSGDGPVKETDSGLDSSTQWVAIQYNDTTANLNLATLAAKSDSMLKKLNLSSGVDCSDLPADASAHWYAGLLYAYSYQTVDERDYLLECSEQRDELDHKLSMAYQKYNDEDYKGGNMFMEDSENDFRRSMTDCCDTNDYFDDMVNKAHDFFDLDNWEDIVDANYADQKELVDHQNELMLKTWNEGVYFNAGMFYGRIWYLLAQGCFIQCDV